MKKILFVLMGICILFLSSCAKNLKDGGPQYIKYNSNAVIDRGERNSNEEYDYVDENPVMDVSKYPKSTFSIDVDTASYANVRRYLNEGALPPMGAIRTEEMVNYFSYDYPAPEDKPLAIYTEVAPCPWNYDRNLAMITIKGKEMDVSTFPESNLVFLIDVSGSMSSSNKLPLVKSALSMLVENLRHEDRISIVVYGSKARTVLEPTRGDQKDEIIEAINSLEAGGSTAGGAGLQMAYTLANEYYVEGGNNRVILATDGDFNVGISSEEELIEFIEKKRDMGIFLSVLGFGTGNYKDSKMEKLADSGNGNYAYIDNINEANKVLVEQMSSTLLTIAKDVKVQVDFNPETVKGYRLIGYENRVLDNEDFENDQKDAGEIGVGFVVTAFYEIIPVETDDTGNLMNIKVRYKEPDGDTSELIEKDITIEDITDEPSMNFLFASSVTEFSLLLRNSKYKGNASYESVIERATSALGEDEKGYRTEFIRLVNLAMEIDERD